MKKLSTVLVLSLMLSSFCALTAFAGAWLTAKDGWWYFIVIVLTDGYLNLFINKPEVYAKIKFKKVIMAKANWKLEQGML